MPPHPFDAVLGMEPHPQASLITLLRVDHSEWDTENGSSGKLAVLSVSARSLQVTKLIFHEDGKMNLIKFPFDKQISMPIGNKVDNSRTKI